MLPDAAVEAPGLGSLQPRPLILGRKFVRARFSGIRASAFEKMRDMVGLVGEGRLSAGARLQRRGALQDAFRRFPIPVIDLFWSGDDAAARDRRRRTMRLHHWYQLDLSPGEAETAPEPVFMGEPDAGRSAEPDFASGRLHGLRALPPREEAPLRDIFSLAHVPDADFDQGPAGPAGAPPPDDDDGADGASAAVEAIAGNEEQVVEAGHEPVHQTRYGRAAVTRDDQQHVTIGR